MNLTPHELHCKIQSCCQQTKAKRTSTELGIWAVYRKKNPHHFKMFGIYIVITSMHLSQFSRVITAHAGTNTGLAAPCGGSPYQFSLRSYPPMRKCSPPGCTAIEDTQRLFACTFFSILCFWRLYTRMWLWLCGEARVRETFLLLMYWLRPF